MHLPISSQVKPLVSIDDCSKRHGDTAWVWIWGSTTIVLSLVWASSVRADDGTCRAWRDGGTHTGNLEQKAIDESSGLARSHRHEHLVWTHNDSGGEARLFGLDTRDASHRGLIRLHGISPTDWEDAALGPCHPNAPETSSCLYVADIGDNKTERDHVSILRFPEPKLPKEDSRSVEVPRSSIERTTFTYPEGPQNAEVLLVHPSEATMYVVPKTPRTVAPLYRIPRSPTSPEHPHEATRVATLRLPHNVPYGRMATAGDIAPSGDEITLRSYLALFTFCVPDDAPFETAFETKPLTASPPLTIQSEALAYSSTGDAIWTTSEQRPAPLIRIEPSGRRKPPDVPRGDESTSGASRSSSRPPRAQCSHDSGAPPVIPWGWLLVLSGWRMRRPTH